MYDVGCTLRSGIDPALRSKPWAGLRPGPRLAHAGMVSAARAGARTVGRLAWQGGRPGPGARRGERGTGSGRERRPEKEKAKQENTGEGEGEGSQGGWGRWRGRGESWRKEEAGEGRRRRRRLEPATSPLAVLVLLAMSPPPSTQPRLNLFAACVCRP